APFLALPEGRPGAAGPSAPSRPAASAAEGPAPSPRPLPPGKPVALRGDFSVRAGPAVAAASGSTTARATALASAIIRRFAARC
ncbi:hypothetical protein K6I34_006707, partial [Streptomyces sp. UNOC14_S4]|nr:hypothetical protein [Streptomyces sp. UNOC14_S4]